MKSIKTYFVFSIILILFADKCLSFETYFVPAKSKDELDNFISYDVGEHTQAKVIQSPLNVEFDENGLDF